MDMRLKNEAVFQIVGPSGCGKTLFVTQLLINAKSMFVKPIGKIYWLMGVEEGEQDMTEKYIKCIPNLTFLNGFEEGWMNKPKQGDVVVIDDLFSESTREKNFNNLFTKIARHRGVTVLFITQNMFHQGGQHRTRNLNVHYLVLFKNPRDSTVINFVARQAFSSSPQFLVDVYKDATENTPHGYIFIDFTQSCPEYLRVRGDIFNPHGLTVYKQAKT